MLFSFLNTVEPCLKALLNELHPVCSSWYNIGLLLDIPYTTLDFFTQNHLDPLNLMREILKEWLKTAVDPRPTWEPIVKALRSPLINEMNVAAQLESKYCAPVQNTVEESNSAKSEGIFLFYDRHQWCVASSSNTIGHVP